MTYYTIKPFQPPNNESSPYDTYALNEAITKPQGGVKKLFSDVYGHLQNPESIISPGTSIREISYDAIQALGEAYKGYTQKCDHEYTRLVSNETNILRKILHFMKWFFCIRFSLKKVEQLYKKIHNELFSSHHFCIRDRSRIEELFKGKGEMNWLQDFERDGVNNGLFHWKPLGGQRVVLNSIELFGKMLKHIQENFPQYRDIQEVDLQNFFYQTIFINLTGYFRHRLPLYHVHPCGIDQIRSTCLIESKNGIQVRYSAQYNMLSLNGDDNPVVGKAIVEAIIPLDRSSIDIRWKVTRA